jgi:hypothetical protein
LLAASSCQWGWRVQGFLWGWHAVEFPEILVGFAMLVFI